MSLRLGMMVKDREHCVGRALESARALVDGYTIIDTGSTDRTKEICAPYCASIRSDVWRDDYGRHRTDVMRACEEDGADWYFMLDSDEEIVDVGDFREVFADAQARDLDAIMVRCVPVMLDGKRDSEPNFRCVRLGRGMRWHYDYDEQLVGWRPDRIAFSTLTIEQDYKRSMDEAHRLRVGYLEPLRSRSEPGSPDWCHATYFLMRSYNSVRDFATEERYALDLIAHRPKALGYSSAFSAAARCALYRGDIRGAWDVLENGVALHGGLTPGGGQADLWHVLAILATTQMTACLADPGRYFATAQGCRITVPDPGSVLRALGCEVTYAEAGT